MLYEVIRPIQGETSQIGDLVDASGWRNRDRLVSMRYLRPAPSTGAETRATTTVDRAKPAAKTGKE